MIKNNYEKKEASNWRKKAGSDSADQELGERVYTSRLIGQNPDLLMHGGGNTSVKVDRKNIFGELERVLHVKGSGWDLDVIEAPGLPGVRLDPLIKLRKLEMLTDEDMVNLQRNNLLNSSSPNPSVETLLHAFLPHKYVDHTHATPFLVLANHPKATDNPNVEGLLLLKHGHFAFGSSAEESYNLIVKHTNEVADYFKIKNSTSLRVRRPMSKLDQLPILRGVIAEVNGKIDTAMPVFDLRNGEDVMNFLKRKDLNTLEKLGMASPDHVLRTKGRPLVLLNQDLERGKNGIKAKVIEFQKNYQNYFKKQSPNATEKKTMLTPDPKHAWIEGIGILGIGKNAKEAAAAADLAEQNIRVRSIGEDSGGFRPLGEKDMFDCEYWSLEQAKLGKGVAPPFQGKVVLITGGAGTIGLETAKAFAGKGANIFLVDQNATALEKASEILGPWHGSATCDITNPDEVKKVMEKVIWQFGGIDILISNAGSATGGGLLELDESIFRKAFELNFFVPKNFSLAAAKIMRDQDRQGQILFNISKQAVNPGNNMGAYGLPKATTMFLMRQLALELGEYGIRVNGINADRIRSGLLTNSFIKSRAKARKVSEEAYMQGNLLKREVEAKHVGEAFSALALMERTTGHVLTVDGGNTAAELR